MSRYTPFRYILLCLVAVLAGCATPKVRMNNSDMAMEVTSKVPVVGAVAFAPDGKSIVTGGWDKTPRLWDLDNAAEIRKFTGGHEAGIVDVVFAPDGRTFAAADIGGNTNFSDDSSTLWEVATGKALKKFSGNFGGKLSFSPDGRYLLGNTGGFKAGTVKLMDVNSATVVKEFPGEAGKISPDGKHLAVWGSENVRNVVLPKFEGFLTLYDLESGREVWREHYGFVGTLAFSSDGGRILAVFHAQPNIAADLTTDFKILNAADGKPVTEFKDEVVKGGFLSVETVYHIVKALGYSPDGIHAMSGDLGAHYKLWDLNTGQLVRPMKMVDDLSGTMLNIAPALSFSPDDGKVVTTSLAAVRIFDVASGDELASMIAFEDGEWLFITPNGYYNASEKGDQYLSVTVGGKPYTIAQFRESFFRPDLVKVALAGGTLKEFRKMADIKPPPTVTIVDTPASVAGQETTVTLKVADSGGGIGDVRLYLNGSAVVLDNSRGVTVVGTAGGSEVVRKYQVKLVNGENALRAIAFNGDNTMQSVDAVQTVTASYQTASRPSLHAVVIGINDYKNPRLQLNYAVADAQLFADTLAKAAAPLFDKVEIHRLLSPEETSREHILAELSSLRNLNPDDLFVFYVASHGTVDDGEYFLVTSNVGSVSTERLKQDALDQNTLKEMVANIPATKKLIVIDTCSAGQLGNAIQSAVLTRGMSEETAMKVLSRAVGSTILSAATSVQEALEGYQGHGLFTFVLAEGLNGKADKGKSGYVKTTELADYVDDQVPLLAEQVFKRAQYPTVSISGMGFPIGKGQ